MTTILQRITFNHVCVWCFVLAYCTAFLNIEELTNTKYALDIMHNPINEESLDEDVGLRLASKHGQDYFCDLPHPLLSKSEKQEDKIPKSTPVGSLLEPLRKEECLKIIKGWWTYEFCFEKYVLQYHMEANGQKGDVTHLGHYEADFDWNKEGLEDTLNSKRHKFNRYHSQTYVNGTACDIIKHDRDTEVRYFCDDSSFETYIERVDEPSTCSYIITIRTPYICSHPRTSPVLVPKPASISCRPVLSNHDYSEFERKEQMRKEKELEKLKMIMNPHTAQENYFGSQQEHLKDFWRPFFPGDELGLKKFLDAGAGGSNMAAAQKMVEGFVEGEILLKMDPFQQKRLLMDVSDLLTIHKSLPTADRARKIQKYIENFINKFIYGESNHFRSNDSPKKRPVKVQIKFQRVESIDKVEDVTEESLSTTDDEDVVDPAWKKLEQDISEGLSEAGYQSEESLFEIRVIAAGDGLSDGIVLNPQEGEKFRQMLMDLVGGASAMNQEKEKQKLLADNYNMVWREDSGTFTSHIQEEEESSDFQTS